MQVLLALAVVIVGAGALGLNVLAKGAPGGAFGGDPPPPLFPAQRLTVVQGLVDPAQARARRDWDRWSRAHPARDDAAFTAFALRSVGPPPSGAAQRRELARLHALDAGRTPEGAAAANWLEQHGKKDVWKLYLKQAGQLSDPVAAAEAKARFKATYALANALEAQGKAHFARLSPYITDPSLHALNQARTSGPKYSYPSKHAVLSTALMGVLDSVEPPRAGEYRWMAEEIDYSRLYAGGHYPSDIGAGAYLGELVALYELHLAPPGKG